MFRCYNWKMKICFAFGLLIFSSGCQNLPTTLVAILMDNQQTRENVQYLEQYAKENINQQLIVKTDLNYGDQSSQRLILFILKCWSIRRFLWSFWFMVVVGLLVIKRVCCPMRKWLRIKVFGSQCWIYFSSTSRLSSTGIRVKSGSWVCCSTPKSITNRLISCIFSGDSAGANITVVMLPH